jgi:hypothetical protein
MFETQSEDAAIIFNFFRGGSLDSPSNWASGPALNPMRQTKSAVCKKNIDTVHHNVTV